MFKKFSVATIINTLFFSLVYVLVSGLVFMLIWNEVVSVKFSLPLFEYLEAVYVMLLCRLLFQGE